MSFTNLTWRRAVLNADLPTATKAVLMALDSHANKAGYACPATATLAKLASVDKRTAVAALARAEHVGLVKIDRTGGGRATRNAYNTNDYWCLIPAWANGGVTPPISHGKGGTTPPFKGGDEGWSKGGLTPPEPVLEPEVLEPEVQQPNGRRSKRRTTEPADERWFEEHGPEVLERLQRQAQVREML